MGEPTIAMIKAILPIDYAIDKNVFTVTQTALAFAGFNMSDWIIKNYSNIEAKLKTINPVVMVGKMPVTLTPGVVIGLSVQIGLGNSSAEKLKRQTNEEGQALIAAILTVTGHKGRETTTKRAPRKYTATEFTFLRCVSAYPYIASQVLYETAKSPILADTRFNTQDLPVALHHGNTYTMSNVLEVHELDKIFLFNACAAVALVISIKTGNLKNEDEIRARGVENEQFVSLQKNHPLMDNEKDKVIELYGKWGILDLAAEPKNAGALCKEVYTCAHAYMVFMNNPIHAKVASMINAYFRGKSQ